MLRRAGTLGAKETMSEHIQVIASTIAQLAQMAVVAYGISAAKAFLIHWLDSRTEPLPPLYPRLTHEEQRIDAARAAGVEA